MNTTPEYDLVVLGGGSAGYAAARTASSLGLKTAVVDGGNPVGGLCILRGCMPSKAIIESANRYWTLRRAGEFGLAAKSIGFSTPEIIARKKRHIQEFADYRKTQLEQGTFDFINGRGRFLDAHTLEVQSSDGVQKLIRARTILLATGSVINQPSIPGWEEARPINSDIALDLEQLPSSLIVLGAGPVALEMAYYFNAFGTQVTILQRGKQLLSSVDLDSARALEDALRNQGITIHTEAHLESLGLRNGSKIVQFRKHGQLQTLEAEEVFNGLGRKPNLAPLNLTAAGFSADLQHLKIQPTQLTEIPHIFAAGDACGPYEIVHIAIQQGELAARNAARSLRPDSAAYDTMDYRLKVFAVFTEPQLACVGLTEKEASEQNLDFAVATYPFNDHGKSILHGETEGFVKLIADRKTGEILGGSVVGPSASELIHEIVVAMQFRATAAQLAGIPHYHPTLSEIWTYPAEELAL